MIVDIKTQLPSPEIYPLFSFCMYNPTLEKYIKRAKAFSSDPAIISLGFFEDKKIRGLIVVRLITNSTAEIVAISVDPNMRGQGIARQLIDQAINANKISAVHAETDADAVEFYRHCGFTVVPFIKDYNGVSSKRYHCILHNAVSIIH